MWGYPARTSGAHLWRSNKLKTRLQISTRNAADEDYFLLGVGEGEAELFCGAAPAGAIDEGAGVDPWDFVTSMILVLIVASLVKGELG